MFKRMMGYAKNVEFFGEVVSVDLIKQTLVLASDDESITARIEDTEILEEAFELHDMIIFDKDVLRGASTGDLFLVERHENGEITTHLLNDKLEIVTSGKRFAMNPDKKRSYEQLLSLEGNFYELLARLPKDPTFNIKIVKDFPTYFYACNNKDKKEIDLIKVIYMGSNILKEEDYERITLSYDKYNEAMEAGIYKEATPSELQNYVTGMMYGKKGVSLNDMNKDDSVKETCGVNCGCETFCADKVVADEPTEDICEDCRNLLSECDCTPW